MTMPLLGAGPQLTSVRWSVPGIASADGLSIVLVFNHPVTIGSGVVSATVSGLPVTLSAPSGSGTKTLTYAVTHGNLTTDAILAGATVLLSATNHAWVSGDYASGAFTNRDISNTSTAAIVNYTLLNANTPIGLFPNQLPGQAELNRGYPWYPLTFR